MAKIKLKAGNGKARGRRIKSSVYVGMDRDGEFTSCVTIGSGQMSRKEFNRRAKGNTAGAACAHGRNPRAALRAALTALAGNIGRRTGAFAGFRGGR